MIFEKKTQLGTELPKKDLYNLIEGARLEEKNYLKQYLKNPSYNNIWNKKTELSGLIYGEHYSQLSLTKSPLNLTSF